MDVKFYGAGAHPHHEKCHRKDTLGPCKRCDEHYRRDALQALDTAITRGVTHVDPQKPGTVIARISAHTNALTHLQSDDIKDLRPDAIFGDIANGKTHR